MSDALPEVILGVDTHADTHTAVVVDGLGRVLGTLEVAATLDGYEELLSWACQFGWPSRAGVEGTGSYGAGLTRYLAEVDVAVVEVNRPNRQRRRLRGKSDPTDAEAAARAVLAGEANRHAQDPHRDRGVHPGAPGGSQQLREVPHPGRQPGQGHRPERP
jgi:transposase